MFAKSPKHFGIAKSKTQTPFSSVVFELERRQMLAGDLGAVAAEVATVGETSPNSDAVMDNDASNTLAVESSGTLVFVDADVQYFDQMLKAIPGSAKVVLLDANSDPLQQMTDAITQHQNLNSIHIISHGRSGAIQLAGQRINVEQLESNQDLLRSWRRSLGADADILLYGCDVATGVNGKTLLARLSQLTGADVAGSTDKTGNSIQNGNWDLEQTVGEIDSSVVFDRAFTKTYTGVLSVTVFAAGDTGKESMSLQIDGTTVATWDNIGGNAQTREFQSFTYNTSSPISADRIRVTFNNDLYQPGVVDRNLHVDRIEVDGQKFETESPTVYSTGNWTDKDGISPGYKQTESLHANGYFQFGAVPNVGAEYRSFDGTGNNLSKPELGSTNEELMRVAAPQYTDGISSAAGQNRPSARTISNVLAAADPDGTRNERKVSAYIYVWGQFLDHDIDLSLSQGTGGEALPIAVPTGDQFFDPSGTGTATIPLTRAVFDPVTGTSAANPRQQLNAITSYIDGSMVYGSSQTTADSLRSFQGGKMLITDDGLLPTDSNGDVMAGDIRASENVALTAIQALFLREHNRLATEIAAKNPGLSDEAIYQQSRAIVIGEIQAITFNEFLPALLGSDAMSPYRGYNSSVDPSIANEFSTAAYRFGHSALNDEVEFFGNDGTPVREKISLADAFLKPALLKETGIDTLLKYEASTQAQEIDVEVVDSLRNFLFGPPGAGGLDLASLNIQRGRDHGLADYNSVREAYGLARVHTFADITDNVELQGKLQSLYGTVDNIDLWVGVLAEDHVAGASMGELGKTIVADQFDRLRSGDRFWYQNVFSGSELNNIQQTTLANIIQRNTDVVGLQKNVFFMRAEVTGQVLTAYNFPGHDWGHFSKFWSHNFGAPSGVAGITIELINDEGEMLDTTVTDTKGNYRFTSFAETGEYKIRMVGNDRWQATSGDSLDVLISNGDFKVTGANYYVTNHRFHT